jgi:fructokinase
VSAAPAPQLAVIGEAIIDLIDEGESPYAAHAGGGPLNIAVGLARLGRPTAYLGRLSRDPLGTVLRAHARRSHVDLSLAVTAPEPSTIALVQLDAGAATYQFGVENTADFQWADAELAALPASIRALHFGSLASWIAPGNGAIDRLAQRMKAAGGVLVSYDPNVRPALQPDRAAARAQVEQSAASAHLIKASEDDLVWLYGEHGDPTPAAVAARWLAAGVTLVVITRGADGAIAFRTGQAPIVQPVHPAPVVDTVGAGDSFMSGVLEGLAEHDRLDPERLRATPTEELVQILARAARISAITCSRAGANPPWADELAAFPA